MEIRVGKTSDGVRSGLLAFLPARRLPVRSNGQWHYMSNGSRRQCAGRWEHSRGTAPDSHRLPVVERHERGEGGTYKNLYPEGYREVRSTFLIFPHPRGVLPVSRAGLLTPPSVRFPSRIRYEFSGITPPNGFDSCEEAGSQWRVRAGVSPGFPNSRDEAVYIPHSPVVQTRVHSSLTS
jgi:hypothetical protein